MYSWIYFHILFGLTVPGGYKEKYCTGWKCSLYAKSKQLKETPWNSVAGLHEFGIQSTFPTTLTVHDLVYYVRHIYIYIPFITDWDGETEYDMKHFFFTIKSEQGCILAGLYRWCSVHILRLHELNIIKPQYRSNWSTCTSKLPSLVWFDYLTHVTWNMCTTLLTNNSCCWYIHKHPTVIIRTLDIHCSTETIVCSDEYMTIFLYR